MATTYYLGVRTPRTCKVWAVSEDGKIAALRPSRRSRQFPSDAWEWGYGGTGPADLAWALVMDATANLDTADQTYQGVKWQVVAMFAGDGWILRSADLQDSIDRVGQDQCRSEEVIDLDVTDRPVTLDNDNGDVGQ